MKFLVPFLIIILAATAVFVSCEKETVVQTEQPTTASVVKAGTSVLTEKDIVEALGNSATPEQVLDYIRRWTDKELASQAAADAGIDKTEYVKKTVENMKKEFLSAQYIQQEIDKIGEVDVSAEEVEKEFREGSLSLPRKEPVIRAAKIVVANLSDGWRVRDGLTMDTFRARGVPASLEPIPEFDAIKFEPRSKFTPEIWNAIFTTRVGGITSPLPDNGKIAIFLVLDKKDVGSSASLEEVFEEVKYVALAQKQNKVIKDIYDSLRIRYNYSYDLVYISRLENAQKRNAQPDTAIQEAAQSENK
jgi:peptide deformylase